MNLIKLDPAGLCIFSLMVLIMIKFVVSQSSPAINCSLDFLNSSDGSRSSCVEGNWGGFLHHNCCGSAFHSYLLALGQRARETGLIYLNATEQRSCFAKLGRLEGDAFHCGFTKLTTGRGGCSNFLTANVTDRLVEQLTSLTKSCSLLESDGDWHGSCGSCIESWQKLKQGHGSWRDEADSCRFAVLVTLTSNRIDDMKYIRRLYYCLAQEGNSTISITSTNDDRFDGKRRNSISSVTRSLIGTITGFVIVFSFIVLIIVLRNRRSSKPPSKKNAFKELQLRKSNCLRFTINEIYSATKNLSEGNLIGEGSAGKVYQGVLSNSQPVAIKHVINDRNVETVVREVTSLSHVTHPNLVVLLGYCVRDDECFLIYELCPNGNLSEWIFGKDRILTWIQRLEIAIDCACGLLFLHTFPEGCIVHRDIKPTNILLGANFKAKLSDFGLSKVINLGDTYASSEVRGTFGYVDPEYQNNRQVESSGDVYSFGIVLLQILSGKRVVNMNLKKPIPLNKMAKSLGRGGSVVEFADPKLEGEYSTEAFDLTFQLALSCTSLKQQRPSMEHVVARLKEALDMSTKAKASSPETTPTQISTF